MSRKRDRVLLIFVIALMCVVGYGTLRIAASSDGGKSGGGGAGNRPVRYVDPEYGFSLAVHSRFAGETAPGLELASDEYVKSWNADDSPTSQGQPLDSFGVVVMPREEPVVQRQRNGELRVILTHPSKYVSGWGTDARLVRVAKSAVDGRPAAVVEGLFVGLADARVRARQVVVPMQDNIICLTAMSSPGTWRRNLPAFESMIASFRLPADL